MAIIQHPLCIGLLQLQCSGEDFLIIVCSVFWTLSYWTDVDSSQTRGQGSKPTHLLLFPVLDQSHLCTACWYNSKSKAWLAAVIKLSHKEKKNSTACFFISMEQTITQLESKQCRWDITKVYKSSHTQVRTPPASSIKVSKNRLDTQTDTQSEKNKTSPKPVSLSVSPHSPLYEGEQL